MAVKEPASRSGAAPAIEEAMQSRATRRMYFGSNVLLMVIFALALVVMVNWLAQRRSFRRDLSSLGTYRLSDRTKGVVDTTAGPLRLTAIYASDEPDKARDKYLPRVRDLLEEFRRYSGRVTVQSISEDSEKRQLAARLEATFSSQATAHREVLTEAGQLYDRLKNWCGERANEFRAVELQNGWLGKFTSFTNSTINLAAMAKEVDKTLEEVQKQTSGALPKYSEANGQIRSLNETLKTALDGSGKFLKDLGELTRSVQEGRETFFTETPARWTELKDLRAELIRAVGSAEEPIPEDAVPALKEFARVSSKLATWLAAEVGRIEDFARRHPIVSQHPRWRFRQQVAILVTETTLPQLLGDVQKDLADMRPQVSRLISSDLEPRKLQNALEQIRRLVSQFDETLESATQALLELKEDLGRVDPSSQALLAAEYYDQQFKPHIDALDELVKKIDGLPALETGELGDKLSEDNVIVIEAGSKAKAVSFDDVWPLSGRGTLNAGSGEARRVFNGDAALGQALLTMAHDKPFATVLISHFEVDVPQNMRRFFPPVSGDIPYFQLSSLEEKLKAANFEVKQWNMGAEVEPQELNEELPVIYLVLPPPDPSKVPPGMANQVQTWRKSDEERLTGRIGKSGRAIFLANYTIPRSSGPFGGGPLVQSPYLLRDYLRTEWGIDVDARYRVTYGIPDPRDPTRFGVSLANWQWLPLNSFTDHPIGRPLRAVRVFMLNVCPVNAIEPAPPGVETWDVLHIEQREDLWGNHDVLRTARIVTDPRSDGWVRKDFDPSDGWADIPTPFSVMVAARNSEGGKVFVTGSGLSYVNDYLDQPIARGSVSERIVFDPPPTANADLMINACYWLMDKENLIASGPILTPVIRPVEQSERRWLSAGVTLWSLLALAAGGAVLFARRK